MRETPLPPTSVIVCSRNRPELLVRAVRSVYEGAQGFNEIVVVDQSDTPNAHLQACGLVYLWRPSRGAGRARNAGIQAASHKVLAFIDDDVIVTPGWLEVLVSALVGTGPRSVVTGMVREGRTESGEGFAPPTLVETKPAVYEGRITKDVLYTGNMAVYRSAFEEIGLF
ncbi:MAG: glycosyltransferase family 2 protein, partial [Bryobacteraceae bacterium]